MDLGNVSVPLSDLESTPCLFLEDCMSATVSKRKRWSSQLCFPPPIKQMQELEAFAGKDCQVGGSGTMLCRAGGHWQQKH